MRIWNLGERDQATSLATEQQTELTVKRGGLQVDFT